MNSLTAKDKVTLALDWIANRHPIMVASATADWRIIPDPSIPTACTNGPTMRYNPAFFDKLNLACVKAVVLHEAAHVLLGHHFRLKEYRNHDLANIAADLAINSHLLDEYRAAGDVGDIVSLGCFPGRGKYEHLPSGKSTEFYMAELLKAKQQAEQQAAQSQKTEEHEDEDDSDTDEDEDDSGADDTEASDDGEESEESDSDTDKAQGAGDGDESLDAGDGEGSGGSGEGQDSEGGTLDPLKRAMTMATGIFGTISEAPQADEKTAEKDWEDRVVTAQLTGSKSYGAQGVGGLLRELGEHIDPLTGREFAVQWKTYLRQFLTRTARGGQNYNRPSRRHGWRKDVIMPSNKSKNASRGLILVDTSASMSEKEFNVALRELEEILRAYPKSTVKMITCDTQVYESEEWTVQDFPLRVPPAWKGGGGTDLNPGFAWAKAYKPDWLVVVTDMGFAYWTVPNPGVPVMWLDTTGGEYRALVETKMGYKLPFGMVATTKPRTNSANNL